MHIISESIIGRIKALANDFEQDVINIRRYLHMNPELSFEEHETSQFIAAKLKEFEIQYKDGIAENGIIGMIEGKNPKNKLIGLRADIDALPVTEDNSLPYKSKYKGKMHACGHDVHAASLLGTAKILNKLNDYFEGTVMLIFQPAEEKIPSGALQMIEKGAFKQ
ncbi:MAG: amidohydrolase, partial [Bacteroidia bacterium]|nr:amidohydrolase [Bacteroidia bacterium]